MNPQEQMKWSNISAAHSEYDKHAILINAELYEYYIFKWVV